MLTAKPSVQRVHTTNSKKQFSNKEPVHRPKDHRGHKEIQGEQRRHDEDRPRDGARDRSIPSWISDERIKDTINTWQPYYADPLTEDDAIEILQSVGHLADVLEEKS